MENNKHKDAPKESLGYKDIYSKYKSWVLQLTPGALKKNTIFAVLIILILPTLSTVGIFFNFPSYITTTISLPAGVMLFAVLLGVAFISESKNPDRVTIKERYSFSQRLKWIMVIGIIAVSLLVVIGSKIPYAFGGIVALAIGLLIYNGLQRTESEIAYYNESILDPRDELAFERAEARKLKPSRKNSKSTEEEVIDE